MSEALTARQAADRLGVSVRTLGRYVAAGLITPGRTPGGHRRFAAADVDALLEPDEVTTGDEPADN